MIVHYCDCCGRQMDNRSILSQHPLGRLQATVKSQKNTEVALTVEIITSKNGVSNAGDFCVYCILDALYQLDDRPRIQL